MQTGRRSNELNNKGFSLVELIVVIAIIVIVGGVIGLAAYNTSRYNVKKMAETFDKGLSRTQTLCMGKDNNNTYMMVYLENNQYKIKVTRLDEDGNEIKDTKEWDLGSTVNTVKYKDSTGTETVLDESNPFAISFDRASGAYKGMVKLSGGKMDTSTADPFEDKYIQEVTFYNDSNTMSVKLYQHTGKHEIR